MKNKIKLFLTLWVIFFTFLNVNAQCETIMKFFKDDIYTSKDLVGFAEKDPQKAFDSWKLLYNEKTGLTKNIENLNLVSKNLDEIKSAGGYLKWKNVKGAGKLLDDMVLAMKADFPIAWKFNKVGDDAFVVLDGAGKKWAAVYQDKIACLARTQIGTAGNPIINRLELIQKNMKYEVDGIIYQTDELGRVLKTNADLDDIARVRLGNQQIKAVDVKDGVRAVDQGGHIVGSRFFGPGEQINIYPQSANLNQGAWKTMENGWADAMVNGSDVKIEVKAIYVGTSKRPSKFEVEYWIDGKYKLEKFDNL